ncbi:hypothetical protein RhiirA4_474555 [Rhizophagus irregularis]|uniref:Uncharacterized protein n=1 Tax=Rhizophagus irregularis TaxID=588596 RepID=A0A2I1H8M3_9GLOM|nr:hypothetical protein RhiirA4_474555 [Rhizophagus irregularis]
MPSTDALETIPEESSSQDGGTVMDQEMDINKDVDEDNTEVQVQPNTSGRLILIRGLTSDITQFSDITH